MLENRQRLALEQLLPRHNRSNKRASVAARRLDFVGAC